MESNYSTFQNNVPVKTYLADPVQDCIAGNFFNGADNPLRYDIGRCTTFMSQRCGRQWDGYCDIYLNEQKKSDFTGKASNEFLTAALDSQFCRINNNLPGSENTCYTRCEQMDPLAPDSAMICSTDGDFIYRRSDKMYNIDTQYNVLGKLSTPEPIRMAACPKICDKFTPELLSNNNRVLNECIDRGIAMDALVNIAENAIAAGVEITNERFIRFIKSFVLTKADGLKPGYSSIGASPMLTTVQRAVPAIDPVIKKNDKYMLSNSALFGPQLDVANANKYKTMTKEEALNPKVINEAFRFNTTELPVELPDELPRLVKMEKCDNYDYSTETKVPSSNLNMTQRFKSMEPFRNDPIQPIQPIQQTSTTSTTSNKWTIQTWIYITLIFIFIFILCYVIFYMK